MRIIIGNIAQNMLDASSVTYSSAVSDPVPTCNLTLIDNESAVEIQELQEILVLDETLIPNPTENLVVNPTLNPFDGPTSGWWANPDSGVTLSQNTGGGVIFTINNPSDNLANMNQLTQTNAVVPGQAYTFSATMTGSVTSGGVQAILSFVCYATAGLSLSAGQSSPVTPTGTPQIVSLTFTPPAGTTYVSLFLKFTFGSGTPVATLVYTDVQLEPNWFPGVIYPTPFCGPGVTNCVELPMGTWIRQYRRFGGFILKATAGNYIGKQRTWQLAASGYGWLLSLRYSNDSYSTQYDDQIMTALLNKYYNSMFNLNNILQGVQVTSLQFNWTDLRSIFDGFAGQSGFYWTADAYWSIFYQAPGYTTMPYGLICDESSVPDTITTFAAYNFSRDKDMTQPGNDVIVIGGSPGATKLTTALVSGSNFTSLDVESLPNEYSSGTTVVIADSSHTQSVTLSATAGENATTLSVNSFNANFSYKVGTSVTPPTNVAEQMDPASIQNYAYRGFPLQMQRFVNDTSLQSLQDCATRALADLLQYDYVRVIYHLSTQAELIAGQAIPVTSNTDFLNATSLLIQQVKAKWLGVGSTFADVWEYQADLGSVNRSATNLLSHLARQSLSSSGAPAIAQTSLVVLERFGITDTPLGPSVYALAVLSDSPAAYYRLGEQNQGTTALDSGGSGYNGTQTGGVTDGEAGAIFDDPDTAMLFDGATGFIALPSGLGVAGWTAISLEAWVKLSNTTYSTGVDIIADDVPASSSNGVRLTISAHGAGLVFAIGVGSGHHTSLTVTAALSAGQWYHIVATWDGATMTLYLNGASVGSAARSGSIGTPADTFAIGYNPAAASNYLPATLDEVAVYNSALGSGRVAAHYQIGTEG